MSRSTFYRHIPKHILTSSGHKHHSCLGEICVEIDLKLNVLNNHLNTAFQGRDSLSELSLCQDAHLTCLNRQCDDYGITQIQGMIFNQLSEDALNLEVKWEQWEPVQRNNCKSKGRERVERTTTLKVLCDALLKDQQTFSMHLFVFRWQYAQFKLCKSIGIRKSLGLAVLDFAENFTCRPQDEVQSAYYGFSQITIHPSVTYYACPKPQCSEIVTEYLVFLTDYLNHDVALAQTILNHTVDHMQSRMQDLSQVVVFSDGCAAQYKSKLPFHFLSDMKTSVAIDRAYFGSRHGKGPCDACGGVIKKAVERDILSRQVSVRNAADMYRHCMRMYVMPSNEPAIDSCCHTRRIFFLLEEGGITRSMKSSELMTLPGTRKMHSIRRVKEDIIQTRNLSCFCSACLDGNMEACINKLYAKPWETIKIRHAIPDSDSSSSSEETFLNHSDESSSLENDGHRVDTNENIHNEAFIEVPPVSFSDDDGVQTLSRESFFHQLQEQLSACESYEALRGIVAHISPSLNLYPLPPIIPKCVIDVGTVDSDSLSFLPKGMDYLFPVRTEADGNCVPRALSLLVFGDQDHHREVRCRIVIELVTNDKQYLSLDENELTLLCQLSDFYQVETECVFQLETLEVCKPSVFMGMWQIIAAANVFQAPVFSVFPSVSSKADCYKSFYNRTLLPRDPATKQTLLILWTSTRKDTDLSSEHWAANHVVPLMPLTTVSEIIVQN